MNQAIYQTCAQGHSVFQNPLFPAPYPPAGSAARGWQTYYEPKPLSELYTGWQEMLAEHRQIIVEVQEIAEELSGNGLNTDPRG